MGRAGDHTLGTLLPQQAGTGADGAAGVDHVVDQHSRFPGHIADHGEALGHVVAGAAFVDDRQGRVVHLLGEGTGPCHPSHVR